MEKVLDNSEPIVARVLEVTPQQLRRLADRLEMASLQMAFCKDRVMLPIAHGFVLMYDPKITLNQADDKVTRPNLQAIPITHQS